MTDQNDVTADLSADGFAAVSMAASKDGMRDQLNGVYVTPWADAFTEGALMVATDGHIMAIYFDRRGSISRSAILRGKFTQSDLKRKVNTEGSGRRVHIQGDVGRVMKHEKISLGKYEWKLSSISMVEEVRKKYPHWQDAMPKFSNEVKASADLVRCWNPDLISRAGKIAKRSSCAKTVYLSFRQERAEAPALIVNDDDPNLWIVVMPVSLRASSSSLGVTGGPVETDQ